MIRLAEIARQSGRAVEAVNELWPLAARAAEGGLEGDTLLLLAAARLAASTAEDRPPFSPCHLGQHH